MGANHGTNDAKSSDHCIKTFVDEGFDSDSDSDSSGTGEDFDTWKNRYYICWKSKLLPIYNHFGEHLGDITYNCRWEHIVDGSQRCINCGLSVEVIRFQGNVHLTSINMTPEGAVSIFNVWPK